MKLVNLAMALSLIVACAAAVLWHTELRAPPPEDVCAHLMSLAQEDAEASFDEGRCLRRLQPPKKFGVLPYAKRMKCMRDAGSFAAAMECRLRA